MILSWQQIPSPLVTEIISEWYDGTVLDAEHGCFNNETLYTCIQVLKLKKKSAFVRLKDISKSMIGMCLDAGADGLIFSTVETKEQCDKIIECSLYPPYGKRGLGLVRCNQWSSIVAARQARPQKELLTLPILIPQIETKAAIDNIENILSDYFQYYLVGPYDLSLSLNIPGEFDNKLFMSYIDKVNSVISKDKMAVHIPNDVRLQIKKYKDYGLKCLGMDTSILKFQHMLIGSEYNA